MNPELELNISNKDVSILLKPATPSVIKRGLCVLKYEGGFSLDKNLSMIIDRQTIIKTYFADIDIYQYLYKNY